MIAERRESPSLSGMSRSIWACADHARHRRASADFLEAARILAAFAGIRLAADAVHGDGQRGVRFGRDRAQRHGAGGETLDDFLGRLDFVRAAPAVRAGLDLEQAAQRHVALALVVDQPGIFLVGLVLAGTRRMLQLGDRIRRPHVLFATNAEGIFAADIEHAGQHRVVAEGGGMGVERFERDFLEADALDLGRRAGEVAGDEIGRKADRLEYLRAAVGLVGRDAHLGHHLHQPLADGLDEALLRVVGAELARQLVGDRRRGSRRPATDESASAP